MHEGPTAVYMFIYIFIYLLTYRQTWVRMFIRSIGWQDSIERKQYQWKQRHGNNIVQLHDCINLGVFVRRYFQHSLSQSYTIQGRGSAVLSNPQ